MPPKKTPEKPVPAKANAGSPTKPSPGRGRVLGNVRSMEEVNKNKPRAKGIHLNACLLDGQLGFFTFTMPDRSNDAYSHNVAQALTVKNSKEFICNLGILGPYFMRRNLEDPRPLRNAKDSFTKKGYVVYFPPEKHNKEGMYEVLTLVKAWAEKPPQTYPNTYVIDEEDWDDTPEEGDLPRLDNFFQYEQILMIIKLLFPDVDDTWYKTHALEADCFFHAGHIPFEASMDLGFPVDKVRPPMAHIKNVVVGKPKAI